MAQELRPPKKKIGDIQAFALIAVSVICDAFKVLLFFFNAVPGIGTALDAIVSFFISVLELLIDFGALGLSGVYSGRGSLTNLLITLVVSAIDFTPIIDDLPITTPTVLFIIWRSRVNYKKELAEYEETVAVEQEQQQHEYAVRAQAAENAAARANAQREQALYISRAANDDSGEDTIAKAA